MFFFQESHVALGGRRGAAGVRVHLIKKGRAATKTKPCVDAHARWRLKPQPQRHSRLQRQETDQGTRRSA